MICEVICGARVLSSIKTVSFEMPLFAFRYYVYDYLKDLMEKQSQIERTFEDMLLEEGREAVRREWRRNSLFKELALLYSNRFGYIEMENC